MFDQINIFDEVRECDYKGEHYSARSDGAIMRHSKGRKRPLDGKWTYGEKATSGYMLFGGERVHRIVATAFHGEAPSDQHVVDHIDTNRCNNRPENLRWLTKLENILLNENTRNKVIYICGSIEAFLSNPQLLYGYEADDQSFAWMRTVTPEEAQATRENLKKLASRPQDISKGAHVGDWIFKQHSTEFHSDSTQTDLPIIPKLNIQHNEQSLNVEDLRLNDGNLLSGIIVRNNSEKHDVFSSFYNPKLPEEKPEADFTPELSPETKPLPTGNPLAMQVGWTPYVNPDFPCCPVKIGENPLQEYADHLTKGAEFVVASYGASTVYESTINQETLLVITQIPNGVKNFGLTAIEWNGTAFVHYSKGTYFEENGVRAAYTRLQGKEWDGPDTIDDYC